MRQWKTGILLFNEVLGIRLFTGPFEVLSIVTYIDSNVKPFNVKTVAQTKETVQAHNGLQVVPDYSFADKTNFDILIVPGGYGAEEIEIHNDIVIAKLLGKEIARTTAKRMEYDLSI